MADNTQVPGGTGDTVRGKDRAGVKTQIVGIDLNIGGAESLMAGSMPVTDNAGSLTVDAPVGTPVFVRLSDGTTAIATLPVSLASVPTHAVTGSGTFTTDPSDRAARELGRARIWDGTDEATVLPRGTVPTAADKGVCVVPLNVTRPGYQAVTTAITSGTAVATSPVFHLWHPSALAKDVFILEIGANFGVVHTAGRFDFELSYTSAIGTGGTTATPQQLNNADPASGVEARIVGTGGGTLKGQIFQRASQAATAAASPNGVNYDGVVIYRAKDLDDYSDALLLRNGQAEGLMVRQNILATITTAPIFNIYVRWVERA